MIFNLTTPPNRRAITASPTSQGDGYYIGLGGLSPARLSRIAQAISNNASITSTTSAVYVHDDYGLYRKISIGDQITLALNGTNYAFEILGFNHDTLTNADAYGAATATGKAGITLQMHDVFPVRYKMDSVKNNICGWRSCEMRTSTMATMKSYLPSAWQSVIKPVNKSAGVGGAAGTTTEVLVDECFLLSAIEVNGLSRFSVDGEGSQYAYFASSGITNNESNPLAVKTRKLANGTQATAMWWLRSPWKGDKDYFNVVDAYGKIGGNSVNTNWDVAFAFCV